MELMGYTDKEVKDARTALDKKIKDAQESLKFELDRLRAEFENFKSKDFRDLENRVTALEKRL